MLRFAKYTVFIQLTLSVCGNLLSAAPLPSVDDLIPLLKDNLTIKSDMLQRGPVIKGEKTFRIYLNSTFSSAVSGVITNVLSDQYQVTITPSPTWKGFPDLLPTSPTNNCSYYSVTLKGRNGKIANFTNLDDIFVQVSLTQDNTPQTIALVPLAETLDEFAIPVNKSMTIDGKVSASKWGNALVVSNFPHFKNVGGAQVVTDRSNNSRVFLGADADNLYLLLAIAGVGANGTKVDLLVAPDIDSPVLGLEFERIDANASLIGKVLTVPPGKDTADVLCLKCTDDPLLFLSPKDPFQAPPFEIYECKIPRRIMGIDNTNTFLANVTVGSPWDKGYWRGNMLSATNPVIFAKFVIKQ